MASRFRLPLGNYCNNWVGVLWLKENITGKNSKEVKALSKWECTVCGYVYDPAIGDPTQDVPPGVDFNDLPDDWRCPECGVEKDLFEEL